MRGNKVKKLIKQFDENAIHSNFNVFFPFELTNFQLETDLKLTEYQSVKNNWINSI